MKYLTPKIAGTYKNDSICDCSVRALANCTGYDYALAERVMRQCTDYNPLDGTTTALIGPVLLSHGFKQIVGYDTLPVALVTSTLKSGIYYVIISEHAFALIHGKIVDLPDTIPVGDFVQAIYKYETDL